MAILIDNNLQPADLAGAIAHVWELSGRKILALEKNRVPANGSPVFTEAGVYTSRGWTEWTQGFQFGSALLQFDATGDDQFLRLGIDGTRCRMAKHITHVGVHDHGFNNVSTYGNLLRLAREGRISEDAALIDFCELALKCSGAVQARRWTPIADGGGFIYSFNGPHSLFTDTIRSLRALALAHSLGHNLMEERDRAVSLLVRLVEHARATAMYAVYYGKGRDMYDVRGRVAHESLFDTIDGSYRCSSTQQGYSPFSTWTRGLAWIMCGYAELLEFIAVLVDAEFEGCGGRNAVEAMMLEAAVASCDFYIENTPTDGIPYWDTGAPGLHNMGNYLERTAEPFNDWEPVDSSAAAIAAQGLLRLGSYLEKKGNDADRANHYLKAGLAVARTVLVEPYLSTAENHQGLILHSVYHRPNGWDYVPAGSKVPNGESSMWGDYHARELALYLQRIIDGGPYYCFFGPKGAMLR